jgi:bacterial/archaeal transporter family-2 protein
MKAFLFALAALAGLSNPIQSAANAGLNKALGPALTGFVVYTVAVGGLLCLSPFLGLSLRDAGSRFAAVPWWAWVGGLCNVTFVLAGALATKQIGSAAFTVTTLTCAVVLSIVLDKFGIMGLDERPITTLRLLGGALAIGGVVLVANF